MKLPRFDTFKPKVKTRSGANTAGLARDAPILIRDRPGEARKKTTLMGVEVEIIHSDDVDLLGQRFGDLVVTGACIDAKKHVTYLCDCNCGKSNVQCTKDGLTSGRATNCGCAFEEKITLKAEDPEYSANEKKARARSKMAKKLASIVGQKFGKLTITGIRGTVRGNRRVACRCECGNDVTAYYANLVRGATKSCGCARTTYKLKPFDRYGMLTVVGDDGTRSPRGEIKWKCKCECGKMTHILGRHIVRGTIRSCGCMKRGPKPFSGKIKAGSNDRGSDENPKVLL